MGKSHIRRAGKRAILSNISLDLTEKSVYYILRLIILFILYNQLLRLFTVVVYNMFDDTRKKGR